MTRCGHDILSPRERRSRMERRLAEDIPVPWPAWWLLMLIVAVAGVLAVSVGVGVYLLVCGWMP